MQQNLEADMKIPSRIILGLLVASQMLMAQESVVIESESAAQVRSRIMRGLNSKPYLDYVAIDFEVPVPHLIARELGNVGIEQKDLTEYFKLIAAEQPTVFSRVYQFKAKPCLWKCTFFAIRVKKLDQHHVSINATPVLPMVATGKEFNIHTFTFTSRWRSVATSEADTLPLLNHIADLLQTPRIKEDIAPAPIELSTDETKDIRRPN